VEALGTAQMQSPSALYRVFSRRTVLLWFITVMLLGGLAGWLIQDYLGAYLGELEQMARHDPETAAARAVSTLRIILGAMACLMGITGFYLGHYGYLSLRAGRFPPPGAWIIEGRRSLTGSRAIWAGWAHLILGAVLVACGSGALHYTWVFLPQILALGVVPGP
jgi:hypothetical protein